VYVNISHYVKWINEVIAGSDDLINRYLQVRLMDLVEDFARSGDVPYEKLDSSALKAAFEQLKERSSDSCWGFK